MSIFNYDLSQYIYLIVVDFWHILRAMNKNKLLGFFRTNENIGSITGQYKQNIHKTTAFKRLDHVKALRKALIARFKDLTKDYNELIEQSDEVLRNAKNKAKTK